MSQKIQHIVVYIIYITKNDIAIGISNSERSVNIRKALLVFKN